MTVIQVENITTRVRVSLVDAPTRPLGMTPSEVTFEWTPRGFTAHLFGAGPQGVTGREFADRRDMPRWLREIADEVRP